MYSLTHVARILEGVAVEDTAEQRGPRAVLAVLLVFATLSHVARSVSRLVHRRLAVWRRHCEIAKRVDAVVVVVVDEDVRAVPGADAWCRATEMGVRYCVRCDGRAGLGRK